MCVAAGEFDLAFFSAVADVSAAALLRVRESFCGAVVNSSALTVSDSGLVFFFRVAIGADPPVDSLISLYTAGVNFA
jgi:hypothetical protein